MKTIYSVLFSMLIFSISFSQENNEKEVDSIKTKQIEIDEVIVVGNVKTAPVFSSVSVDNTEKIVQPKNVADLFKDINGFSIIKRGNYSNDPSFRAAKYEQLNVMYDGGIKAVNACANRMDPITTHVIPEEVSKVEIIKGPYSVRYGATFGGIINLVTQKPKASEFGFHGKTSFGYETNGNALVTMFQLQQITNKYDIVANVGYRDFGNYEDGRNVEIPSSFRSTDYGIKLGYSITDNQRLKLHWRQSYGRDVLHAGLPMDTEFDNSTIVSLDYKLYDIGNVVRTFNAKVYYSFVDHLMTNFRRPSFSIVEASSPVEATTIGGKLELKWNPSEKFKVFSGVDAMYIARDGVRNRLVKVNMMGVLLETPLEFEDKVWQDSFINTFGLFTETKWYINNNTIVTAGLRYDIVSSDIQDPEDDFAAMYELKKRNENNISGTLSVKKLVTDNFTFEAAYGRGVRSANMIERFINHFNIGQDPYEYIGNPNLKAEVNNQFEIGFKGKEKLSKGFNSFRYEASFYYSFFENLIVAQVDESLSRKFNPTLDPIHPKVFQNIDKAYKTGFEIMANIDFLEDYFFKTELAYIYTKNKDFNESLPLTPPFKTKLSIGFEKDKFWANANYTIVSKQANISERYGETKTNGYETLDLKIGVKPIKNVTLGVAVLNVFDRTYHDHLNFSFTNQSDFGKVPINDSGRNVTAFLQYKF